MVHDKGMTMFSYLNKGVVVPLSLCGKKVSRASASLALRSGFISLSGLPM